MISHEIRLAMQGDSFAKKFALLPINQR